MLQIHLADDKTINAQDEKQEEQAREKEEDAYGEDAKARGRS